MIRRGRGRISWVASVFLDKTPAKNLRTFYKKKKKAQNGTRTEKSKNHHCAVVYNTEARRYNPGVAGSMLPPSDRSWQVHFVL